MFFRKKENREIYQLIDDDPFEEYFCVILDRRVNHLGVEYIKYSFCNQKGKLITLHESSMPASIFFDTYKKVQA